MAEESAKKFEEMFEYFGIDPESKKKKLGWEDVRKHEDMIEDLLKVVAVMIVRVKKLDEKLELVDKKQGAMFDLLRETTTQVNKLGKTQVKTDMTMVAAIHRTDVLKDEMKQLKERMDLTRDDIRHLQDLVSDTHGTPKLESSTSDDEEKTEIGVAKSDPIPTPAPTPTPSVSVPWTWHANSTMKVKDMDETEKDDLTQKDKDAYLKYSMS